MLALVAKGRGLVKSGKIDEGLELIDEATAAAVSGQLDPYSTTLVYCMTISSCQDVGDLRRAAEWTEAANRWCDRLDVAGFPGACRVHRAELMRMRGDLAAAEKVAIAACDELLDFERYITAGGYYEIGEIRRRRGPACRRGGLRTSERAGSRPAARPCPAPARGGEARCRGRGNHPRAPGGGTSRFGGFAATGPGRDRGRGSRPEDGLRGRR